MILNHHKQKFDWENDYLDNSEGLVEDTHREIPAQMPGINLEVEQDFNRDMIKILNPSEEELAFESSNNYGLEPETPAGSLGVFAAPKKVVVDMHKYKCPKDRPWFE